MMRTQNDERKTTWARILIYLAIAFTLTYILVLLFVLPAAKSNRTTGNILYSLMAAAAMMMPSIAVVITRLITREGFGDHHLKFVWKKDTRRYYILAWFLPAFLTMLGGLIYFLIFRGQFDWNMSYYWNTIAKTGTDVTVEALRSTVISQLITAVILGPVMNCITCFGEEWGWRGYLLPKLMKLMPVIPAILLTGVIWGLWHIPYIIAGLNYGMEYVGYPYLGFLMMTLFCVMVGIFLSYVTIKSGSCIPAIIGHGAVNSIAAVGVYFTIDGGKLLFGPAITGLVGMIPVIITAVILTAFLARNSTCVNETTCDTMIETSSGGDENVG